MHSKIVIPLFICLCSFLFKGVNVHASLQDDINEYRALSDSAAKKEQYEKAVDFKRKELNVLLHFNDMEPIADCGQKLGLLYYHLGNYHSSLLCFEKAAAYYDKTQNQFHYATLKVNEANVYTRLDKYAQAIHQMQLAEKVYLEDSIKNATQLVGLYANLGLAYYDLPNLDSASYYYDRAEMANQTAKRPIYTAVIMNNRGDIYLANDSLNIAEDYFLSALKLADSLNYALLIATTKLNLGTIETKRGNYSKSLQYLNECLKLYEDLNSLYFIAEANEALSDCYLAMGDHDLSLRHLKEFIHLEDSLKGAETLDRIANLEMEVALQGEKQRFQIVQKEKELAEANARYQKTFLYFLIGLILLGMAAAFFFIRGLRASVERNKLKAQHLQQRQQMLENELNFKKKEIENFSTYILEKNNILNEVKEVLVKIKKDQPDSEVVREAVSTVSHNLHIDQDRKELDLKIDQAHQEFMSRLLQKHPKLTKTEQRLCSLLLMELSTKDISNIMNVEPDSVKKSRSRLRKKLGLEPKTDLTDFLKSI